MKSGSGIPDGPVERVELGIVRPGQPGRAARVIDRAPLPRLGSWLAALRDGPEAPDLLPGRLIVRRDETAHAFVAAGHTGHHEVANHERRPGGAVVLAPVRHLRVPEQRAGHSIERDHVRVVGHHEHAISRHRCPAIDAATGVADRPLRPRPLVVPDLPPGPGIERITLVAARDVHHAFDDHRRALQPRSVRQVEQPLRHEARDVRRVDLRRPGCGDSPWSRRYSSANRSAT